MIPSFTRVALTLKGLIEDKVNIGESKIDLTPYISQTTLDIIGLVGEIFFLCFNIYILGLFNFLIIPYFRI
jgi:hypothetical protein